MTGKGTREARVILSDPAAAAAFGARLGRVAAVGDAITLSGPLGAGKTSIARGILRELGLESEAPSPSFAIVQPYDVPEVRIPVLHVDLYRIEDPEEAYELGLDDARMDSLLLVEWPERLDDSTWSDALRLTIDVAPDGTRALTADVPPAWKTRWPLT